MDAAAKALEPGSAVNLRGEDGRDFGSGTFNPRSLIAVRLLDPACDAAIDADFFTARLSRALALRDLLYARPFYRLCHAEGDGLPGAPGRGCGSAGPEGDDHRAEPVDRRHEERAQVRGQDEVRGGQQHPEQRDDHVGRWAAQATGHRSMIRTTGRGDDGGGRSSPAARAPVSHHGTTREVVAVAAAR